MQGVPPATASTSSAICIQHVVAQRAVEEKHSDVGGLRVLVSAEGCGGLAVSSE